MCAVGLGFGAVSNPSTGELEIDIFERGSKNL
jgi:hypothetical protein